MKKTMLTILCLTTLVLTTACASNTTGPLPSISPLTTGMPSDMMPMTSASPLESVMPGGTMMPDNNTDTLTPEQAQQAAKRISDEVTKLSEVDKATTVVMGNTALIGVNFTTQYKGDMTTRIKDMVTDRAQKAEPAIKTVAVTADPDLLTRIQAMAGDVTSGNIADIGTQFTEILNRIMPR